MEIPQATRLKGIREERGLNRSELARRAEVQPNVISWAESGRFYPYPCQIERIAAALGFEGDPAELFEAVG